MKKRLVAMFLILALIAVSLTGCTFVKLNDTRQAERVIRSVSKDGITLDVSYMELSDYVYQLMYQGSTPYYQYVSNGYLTMEQVVDTALMHKTQSKALTIDAIAYLNKIEARNTAKADAETVYETLKKQITGAHKQFSNKAVIGALTIAEYYDALISVNDSIKTVYDSFYEEYLDGQRSIEINKADVLDVKSIEIVGGLKEEYYVGESAPKASQLLIEVVYKNASKASIQFPVTASMIKTDTSKFTTQTAGEYDYTIALSVQATEDGKVVSDTVSTTKKYTVVEAPATKAAAVAKKLSDAGKTAETETYIDKIRYMNATEIANWAASAEGKKFEYSVPQILDLDAAYKSAVNPFDKDDTDSAGIKKALEKTIAYLEDSSRTLDYYYANAFESAILTAFQQEVYNGVERSYRTDGKLLAIDTSAEFNTAFKEEVMQEIARLANTDKAAYDLLSAEDKKEAFVSAIGDALDKVYSVPAALNATAKGYVYVSHMLLKIDDANMRVLGSSGADNNTLNMLLDSVKADELNPRYDVTFSCDGCTVNADGSVAHNADKCSDHNSDGKLLADKSNCKSIAYTNKDVAATAILENLSLALNGKTGGDAVAVFNEYVEKYGQDGITGILAKENGYLITPDTEDMGWVDGFEALGILLAASGNYNTIGVHSLAPETDVVNNMTAIYGSEAQAKYDGFIDQVYEFTGTNGVKIAYTVANNIQSDGSGSFSGYAGFHIMMVTFCPFADVAVNGWGANNTINLDTDGSAKDTVMDAKAKDKLATKQSAKYKEITTWLNDYEKEEDGYAVTYKNYDISDHKKLDTYVTEIVKLYTGE